MWEEDFALKYFSIVDKYREVVTAQLFGHVHCNSFVTFLPFRKVVTFGFVTALNAWLVLLVTVGSDS